MKFRERDKRDVRGARSFPIHPCSLRFNILSSPVHRRVPETPRVTRVTRTTHAHTYLYIVPYQRNQLQHISPSILLRARDAVLITHDGIIIITRHMRTYYSLLLFPCELVVNMIN